MSAPASPSAGMPPSVGMPPSAGMPPGGGVLPSGVARAARRSDARAHAHAAWWAFLVHRLSGLGLALFLPLHFWVLGEALQGEAALERSIRFVDRPLFKLAEWALVVLLSLHLVGGMRLLLIEFGPWSGVRKDLIAAAVGVSVAIGMAFALALIS